MENIFYEGAVLWSQIDANMHLRHSAYADFAAQARLGLLEKIGLKYEVFQKLRTGPVLFREELKYLREVRINDSVRVTCELLKTNGDGSRWSIRNEIYRSDGIKAAVVDVEGAWLNVAERKLTVLPPDLSEKFLEIPKSPDFSSY